MEPDHQAVQTPDGRSLATHTWGSGERVVVLESALGLSGLCWAPVANLLDGRVRAVAYDRAGYGASTPGVGARTLDALAADLACVIEAQGVRDVVLVGHSWGGPIVRRAVELMPAGVVSLLVLVDPSDERTEAYFTRRTRALEWVHAVMFPSRVRAKLLKAGLRKGLGPVLAADELEALISASASTSALRACAKEGRRIRAGLLQLREGTRSATVPTVLISGTKPAVGSARRDLLGAHQRSVAANPGWRLVEAPDSGHYVLFTQPQLVADEILRACGLRVGESG